jgi:hypothetical protein
MINKIKTVALGTVAALAIGVTAAQAAPLLYASGSTSAVFGTNGGVDPARSDITAAFGASDGSFYSLGLGGSAVFTFLPATLFKSPGAVVEVTKGSRDGHAESMSLYGVLAGVETLIGTVTNAAATATFTFAGVFDSLKVVDTSPVVAGRDGFDIDSIGITPAAIPLPAGGLLLLGALGGIAALRRRKSV